MTDIAAMLNSYPGPLGPVDQDAFVLCVQECLNCAQACTACADACQAESDGAGLGRCASIALDCADIAGVTWRVLSRRTGFDARLAGAVLRACVEACRACYDECRRHALDHEYCRVGGEACHRCAQACRALLASMG
jgi:hypothetical protein